MEQDNKLEIVETGEATGLIKVAHGKPITVIGTKAIRDKFDVRCLEQAVNSKNAPGVTELVLNPDAHAGYGAPVGCVLVSPTHVYPGPVGPDIKCSMSLLQMNIPADQIASREVRREIINAIAERIPTGAGKGSRSVKKGRKIGAELGFQIATLGATEGILSALGIPPEWALRCEDSTHTAVNFSGKYNDKSLGNRMWKHMGEGNELETFTGEQFLDKLSQIGSYGGGNHFGECNIVNVGADEKARVMAESFGLLDGHVSFLSHCGSRGFGFKLAAHQFSTLQKKFELWGTPLPGDDDELVYAPLGTVEADDYLNDMSLGANFATVNHMLINQLVLEAFQQVLPGTKGWLVYYISHNIVREEVVGGKKCWVHRKGATRAFPAGHFSLKGTAYYGTGHPILLPGNPRDGSVVMVADKGADKSCYSVNHGAGRAMGRKAASRALNQGAVDKELEAHDILSNCRTYPIDEAPDAYKDFNEVLASVRGAGLASEVARLKARFVLKDGDTSNFGAA